MGPFHAPACSMYQQQPPQQQVSTGMPAMFAPPGPCVLQQSLQQPANLMPVMMGPSVALPIVAFNTLQQEVPGGVYASSCPVTHGNQQVARADTHGTDGTAEHAGLSVCGRPCYLKMLLAGHKIGAIMGYDGQNITEVETTTACGLQVSAVSQCFPGTHDRIVVMCGELPRVEECTRALLDKAIPPPERHRPATAKLVVPCSAVSIIIGHKGEAVKQMCSSTNCKINIGRRVDNFQERLLLVTGEYPNVVEAVLQVCREIQQDEHLKEHLTLSYSVTLPLGIWWGERTRAIGPDVVIIHPDDADTYTKRELITYLRRVGRRELLMSYRLLGHMRNCMKCISTAQLHQAVHEAFTTLAADCIYQASEAAVMPPSEMHPENSDVSDRGDAALPEHAAEESVESSHGPVVTTIAEEDSQALAPNLGDLVETTTAAEDTQALPPNLGNVVDMQPPYGTWALQTIQAWLGRLERLDASELQPRYRYDARESVAPRHCCDSMSRACSRGFESIFGA